MTLVLRPAEYDSYYDAYISNLPAGTLTEVLTSDLDFWESFFEHITEEDNLAAYAPGKWTVKQVIQHCLDTERIFSTRALMFARGETQNIPGYDHEVYALNSGADNRTLFSLKAEFLALRNSSRVLFESFSKAEMKKAGIANGNKVTVQALAYIIPGHCIHHFQVLRRKYGLAF